MFSFSRRVSRFFLSAYLFTFAASLHAVTVHGTVTDPLGQPVKGALVALVQNGKVMVSAQTGVDGSYQISLATSGRYYVLASGKSFRQLVTQSFYSDTLGSVEQNVVLEPEWVRQSVVVSATGTPTPEAQLSASITKLDATDLQNRSDVVGALRQVPGVNVVQTGQRGGVTSLFVRGGNSDANKVVLDGVPIEDIGGRFDFSTLSTMGIANAEVYRGPNSVLYGSNAAAGVVAFTTPQGSTQFPSLLYEGDAGNFGVYRNQVQLAGMRHFIDYYAGFSDLQTQNSIPNNSYHNITSVANLGWNLSTKTAVRGIVHNINAATDLPGTTAFYGMSNDGKQSDQNIFFSGVIDHKFTDAWQGFVRYGLVRKREQSEQWYPVGNLINGNYYGNVVTIQGANGYSATGQAFMNSGGEFGVYPNDFKLVSNNDNLYAQTTYQFNQHVSFTGGFRYENERGSEKSEAFFIHEAIERTNYDYTGQLNGEFKNRLYYSLGGGVSKNQVFGTVGVPRIGAAYYLVRPGAGVLHGTKLSFNFSKGQQEPTLSEQIGSLYNFLLQNGGQASVQQYGIRPIRAELSRSYDGGVQQSLFSEKVVLRATYFHNEFGDQIESVGYTIVPQLLPNLSAEQQQQLEAFLQSNFAFSLDLNSLSFRAQGVESEIQYGLGKNLFMRGGYTYLDAVVQHSFTSDAVNPSFNPAFPNIPIGNFSPLRGARPFRRPPHTGFTTVTYTGKGWTGMVTGTFASESDDSTFLGGSDPDFGNSLLLPNRNLDHGYVRVDVGATYQVKPWLTAYTQLDNLLSQQHITPIGYPSLPFSFRSGLRFALGHGSQK